MEAIFKKKLNMCIQQFKKEHLKKNLLKYTLNEIKTGKDEQQILKFFYYCKFFKYIHLEDLFSQQPNDDQKIIIKNIFSEVNKNLIENINL